MVYADIGKGYLKGKKVWTVTYNGKTKQYDYLATAWVDALKLTALDYSAGALPGILLNGKLMAGDDWDHTAAGKVT